MRETLSLIVDTKLKEKLQKSSRLSGLSEDFIVLAAINQEVDRMLNEIHVNLTLVTLVRKRESENESWSDMYILENSENPEKTIRDAVEEFLLTDDGFEAIKNSSDDFNWGDAVMFVPDSIWEKHGIYEVKTGGRLTFDDSATIIVNQDEILIPDGYENN